MGAYAPMIQLFASAGDLARFIMLQFREDGGGADQILASSTLREMHAPVWIDSSWTFGTATGWRLGRLAGQTMLAHDGLVHGFSADVTLVPELKLGIAVCANAMAYATGISRTLLEPLIALVDHSDFSKPGAEQAKSIASGATYVGHYRVPGLVELDIMEMDRRLIARVNAPFRADVPLTPEIGHQFRMDGGPSDGELAVFHVDEWERAQEVVVGGFVCERASKPPYA